TDRLLPVEMMRELGEVTFESRQFLGNIGAVGEEGDFFEQTFVVTGNGQTRLLNTIEERRTVPFDHIGVKHADFLEFFPHRLEPVNQILGEMPAFALARNIFIDRLANARLELGQIARQIDYDIALLSIHRIEFDAKLCSVVMDLGAAVTSHASHNRSASRKRREITNRNKRRNLYCFLSYESAPAAKRGECARATSALAAGGASCCDCRGRWVGLSASASCRFCLGR